MKTYFNFSGKAYISNIFPKEEGKDYVRISLSSNVKKDENGKVVDSGQQIIAYCKGYIMRMIEKGKFEKKDYVEFEGTMYPNEEYLSEDGSLNKRTTFFINKMMFEAYHYPQKETEELPNV